MEIYVIVGKWPYARFGIPDYINQKIVYIPEKNVKFCVDDRDIRNLYNKEEVTLERMLGILDHSRLDSSIGHVLRSKSSIFILRKKINNNLLKEILKAYDNKNKEFFFTNPLFQKSSKS